MIIIDAATLIILLQVVQEESMSFLTAAIISFVAAIGTGVLAMILLQAMGILGLIVAGLIGAAGVGVAVSALFGVEIKRAMLIGGIFVAVHIAASVTLQLMMS